MQASAKAFLRAALLGLGTLVMAPNAVAQGAPTEAALNIARLGLGLKDDVALELDRRKRMKAFRSNLLQGDPGHFEDLLRPAPYKVWYGGRDARKSWAYAEALVRRMNERPTRWLCTRMYQNSIKDSVHRVLQDTVFRLGLEHRFKITSTTFECPATRSEALFKGLQKPNELKSTEGCDGAWIAEGQDLTKDAFNVVEPTIRANDDVEIWIDFNVTSEDAFVYDFFVKNKAALPPGSIVHHVNYDSNPYLSARSKERIERMRKNDHDSYLHIYEGLPKKMADALIFKHWRVEGFPDDLYLEAIRQGGRLFYGLDHGFAHDPYALIRFFILGRKLYIEYEAFGWQTEFAGQMAPGLTKDSKERGELEQLLDSVPDVRVWPIKADNSRPETISFLNGKGFQVTAAEKWEGSVEDGVAWLKGFDEIIIHTRCKNMAEEARMYSFKVDKVTKQVLPVIVDSWNHGWDAIRYALDQYIKTGDLGVWAALGQ